MQQLEVKRICLLSGTLKSNSFFIFWLSKTYLLPSLRAINSSWPMYCMQPHGINVMATFREQMGVSFQVTNQGWVLLLFLIWYLSSCGLHTVCIASCMLHEVSIRATLQNNAALYKVQIGYANFIKYTNV